MCSVRKGVKGLPISAQGFPAVFLEGLPAVFVAGLTPLTSHFYFIKQINNASITATSMARMPISLKPLP